MQTSKNINKIFLMPTISCIHKLQNIHLYMQKYILLQVNSTRKQAKLCKRFSLNLICPVCKRHDGFTNSKEIYIPLLIIH
jgi:hypothetical protein